MLSKVLTTAVVGVDAHIMEVEVDIFFQFEDFVKSKVRFFQGFY